MIKVLIVDDETTTRNGLLKYVHWAALGAEEIRTASGGEEALRLCESWPPDIVISDIRMADLGWSDPVQEAQGPPSGVPYYFYQRLCR